MADKFSALFEVEFESLSSVQGKLKRLTDGLKGSQIKLNFDTSELNNIIGDLTKLSRQQISILPSGEITTLQKFNDELGRTISIRENLSKGTIGINIDDNISKKLQEEQKLINDIANAREKSELKRRSEIKKTEQAQTDAINKALEGAKKEEQQVREYIKLEQERLRLRQNSIQISRGSLINDISSKSISDGISGLSASSMDEAKRKVTELNMELTKLDQSARMKGLQTGQKNVTSFAEGLKRTATNLGLFASTAMVINQLQNAVVDAVSYIRDLDGAMIDLKKVTDETDATYSAFLNNMSDVALQLGTQSKNMVEATTNWAKTGETFEDAQKLAENTILLTKIGDIDSVETAQSYLVPALKSFNIEAEDSIDIIDKFNNISNNMATSTADVGQGLNVASNSLAVAGNTLEESIALISTASSTTQASGNKVGNA